MLDNGYVYPAASRLTAYYSPSDWALVIEVFGYSPRAGDPDIHVYTFASTLHKRDTRDDYVSEEAYLLYLANHPNDESRFFWPIDGDYQDHDNAEFVSVNAQCIFLRQSQFTLPDISEYARHDIDLVDFPRVRVFELCRFLAATHRESCLATNSERRSSVRPEMEAILQLEEWHHPDLLSNKLPSASEAFQQLALALAKGDKSEYKPTEPANTHWSNWPEAGTL
ncbi:MAG: hypothetical protein WBO10_00005 [Pyrinomonadaceae bacterium]